MLKKILAMAVVATLFSASSHASDKNTNQDALEESRFDTQYDLPKSEINSKDSKKAYAFLKQYDVINFHICDFCVFSIDDTIDVRDAKKIYIPQTDDTIRRIFIVHDDEENSIFYLNDLSGTLSLTGTFSTEQVFKKKTPPSSTNDSELVFSEASGAWIVK